MKKLLLASFWLGGASLLGLAASQNPEEAKNEHINRVLTLFYNHLDSVDKHAEAKKLVTGLIEKCPDNPFLYELWCSIEWSSIGLELGVPIDARRDIANISAYYRSRTEKYHEMVSRGLRGADEALSRDDGGQIVRQKWLFAKGALYFAEVKFSAKFEGVSGLRRSDEAGVTGIRTFRKILDDNPNFSAPFSYLGSARYKISTQGLATRIIVRFSSRIFAEIDSLCEGDVVNKNESIQWLERAYAYGAPEPWLQKNWIESAFVLHGAYEKLRIEKGLRGPEEKEFILDKELPVLLWLLERFSENKKLREKQLLLGWRLRRFFIAKN